MNILELVKTKYEVCCRETEMQKNLLIDLGATPYQDDGYRMAFETYKELRPKKIDSNNVLRIVLPVAVGITVIVLAQVNGIPMKQADGVGLVTKLI